MTSKQKWLIGGAIALVVVLIATAFAWFAGDDSETVTTDSPATTSAGTPPPAENGTGAQGFGNPVTDLLGRKVLTPKNGAGETLPQQHNSAREQCPGPDGAQSPTGVVIENTWGVQSLLSTSDGPREVRRRILVGYEQSYQGAVLAAWNYIAAMKVGGDSIPQIMSAYGLLDPETRTKLESATGFEEQSAVYKAGVLAPEAFRIVSCDPEYVAMELALPVLDSNSPNVAARTWAAKSMTMVWSDGDWKVQSDKASSGRLEPVSKLDEWTRWAS